MNKIKFFRSLLIILIAIVLLIANVTYIHAQTDELFKEAAKLYEKGSFNEALQKYSEVLEKGCESGNLYYNMGNSYFKADNIGKAVLYYKRALRLIPSDSDLLSNYDYAKSKIKNNGLERQSAILIRIIAYPFSSFNDNRATVILSALYILMVLLLTARVYFPLMKKPSFILIIILCGILLCGIFTLYKRSTLYGKEAVIIKDNAEAKFGPFDKATAHYTIYEGTIVTIIEKQNNWYKIERADGKVGWINKDAAEII
ncbi:membrane protein containing DUF1058 [Candidatus Magnetoovum chiemensis]|nr:membrane protein containing DUF1058 [Candidatus Magnetoovum chiemensis]